MAQHLLHKTWQALLTLFLTVVVIFFGIRALPGDAATAMAVGEGSLEASDAIRQIHGLDQPLHQQFVGYMGALLQGDLGRSMSTGIPVTDAIGRALPVTVQLAVMSILIASLMGMTMGIVAALRRGKPSEMVANTVALLGLSVPNFWLGLMGILLLSVTFQILPASGYVPFFEDPVASLRHMIMPAIVLGTSLAAVIMRQTRSAMLETMSADYIRTARAKGLGQAHIVFWHALRNSLTVVVTVIGLQLGVLISGTVITEQVFVIPGLGKLTLDAIFTRDYPMIQGVVLIIACGYIVINLATDVLYTVIDPRIRLSGGVE